MALPEILTVEELFRSPVRAGATISPDGTKIAFLAPVKNRLNVWVQSIDSLTTPVAALAREDAVCVTADADRSVFNYEWTDDPRWLLYTQDTGGDENWHVFRVDLDNPDTRQSTSRRFQVRKRSSNCLPVAPARRWSASTTGTRHCSTPTNSTSPQAN